MEILTYPIGIVVGLMPVVANLGAPGATAELLLDGEPMCALTAEAPRCEVDLGADPRVHLLELVRRDEKDEIVERIRRWVNRPGGEAEVYLRSTCAVGARECEVSVGWAHPAKQEPRILTVTVDGAIESREVTHAVLVPAPDPGGVRVVSADAIFPDGRRASQTRVLGAQFGGSVETTLVPVPVVFKEPPKKGSPKLISLGGMPVRAVEDSLAEVVFVVEPLALESMRSLWQKSYAELRVPGRRLDLLVKGELMTVDDMTAVVPNERLARFDLFRQSSERERWLEKLAYGANVLEGRSLRLADAVAAAGMLAAGGPRRRVVVLMISGRHEDASRFSSAQVVRDLDEIMVPLLVWRVDGAKAPGWPPGPAVSSTKLLDAVKEVRKTLDEQHIVWVEGDVNPALVKRLPAEMGFEIAGRDQGQD